MRRRGNPSWGRAELPLPPAGPSEFELEAKRLKLKPEHYVGSVALRAWCVKNCNRWYVPEWLLEAWRIEIDPYMA
jgi:hypothetical protein